MILNPGFFLRWLLESTLRKLVQNVPLPATITFQTGTVKGRIIVDQL